MTEGEISQSELDVIFPIRKWMRDIISYKDRMEKASFSTCKRLSVFYCS